MHSYRISHFNTNNWLHSNTDIRSTTTATLENDVQTTVVVPKKQSKSKDSVFRGDPREFLG